jgi:hypothetical protein
MLLIRYGPRNLVLGSEKQCSQIIKMGKKSFVQHGIINALMFVIKTIPESEESKSHLALLESISKSLEPQSLHRKPRTLKKYEVHHHSGETVLMTMSELSKYIKFSEPSIRVRLSRGDGSFTTTRMVKGEETLITVSTILEVPR